MVRILKCRLCNCEYVFINCADFCSEECRVKASEQHSKRLTIVSILEERTENYKKQKALQKKSKRKNKGARRAARLKKLQEEFPNKNRQELLVLLKQSPRQTHLRSKKKLIRKLKQEIYRLKNNYKAKRAPKRDYGFYDTKEWKLLRFEVLKRYGRSCMNCKRTEGEMHVDHIIPRSLNPSLELVYDNLQVLCKECNEGKSNKDFTDFRPKNVISES